MGLFGKLFDKKECSVCGGEIGLLGNRKLEDGNLCKECAAKLSPWFSDRRQSTVAEIQEQLAYREANQAKVSSFRTTRTLGERTKVLLDEDAGLFMVTSARNWEEANPDVLSFSDVTGCKLDIDESRTEIEYRDKDGDRQSFNPKRYAYSYDFYIVINVNIYVTFGTPGEQMGNEDYFALMNENYDRIFDVVDINHGIIQRFDGAGMLALFPGQTRDALNTAISLKEIMAREERPVELKILISRDKTLVGVAGNQKRQTITAISKTIMDIYALNSLMDEIGTRYIITRRGVEGIGEDSYFSCREIGAGDWGRESLYEFLDGMDTYEKKLHLITREEFEKGIHDYQQKRYFEARKHFASVLQTNQRDQVAMYYLMLCDTHSQEGMARQN